MAVNCNGWLAVDVARIWEKQWLEHVLSPKSQLPIPKFTPSAYLPLPLASLLTIARDYDGLLASTATAPLPDVDKEEDEEDDACAVCLERHCTVAAEVCGHELCAKCAVDLRTVMKAYEVPGLPGAIPCPLCRSGIASFRKAINASPSPLPSNKILSCCSYKNCGVQQQQHGHHNPIASCRSYGSRSDGGSDMDAAAENRTGR